MTPPKMNKRVFFVSVLDEFVVAGIFGQWLSMDKSALSLNGELSLPLTGGGKVSHLELPKKCLPARMLLVRHSNRHTVDG